MFNKFIALISTVTVFCSSVTPALANRVKVVRNCAVFDPVTGVQLRRTPNFGMFNLVKYVRSKKIGTHMAIIRVWDPDEQRKDFIVISNECLESNNGRVVEYPQPVIRY
jgi:hypothetical protein